MKKNIGFIGCGKMASAIISGIMKSAAGNDFTVAGSEVSDEFAKTASQRLGIEVMSDNKQLVSGKDIVFVATKPNSVVEVLDEIKPVLSEQTLVVSIAAGVSTEKISGIIPNNRVVRIMPNTPALVNLGMFGICKGANATDDDMKLVEGILAALGKTVVVEESQMDIVTAISGSGPAFFYQVIEDMARAGEKLGLDYDKSLMLAAQTALGSAQMIFDRGETSVQTLIDNVATKGGCTYVGICEMKDGQSDKLFYDVIDKTTQKAHALGQG
ncbi:MAG: pyrroline-5-carboxylate reductase [Muribaculaceae bacterium]|nr:pyrroline-5-carboxylate reductase [Muribaculaceae bacterium]